MADPGFPVGVASTLYGGLLTPEAVTFRKCCMSKWKNLDPWGCAVSIGYLRLFSNNSCWLPNDYCWFLAILTDSAAFQRFLMILNDFHMIVMIHGNSWMIPSDFNWFLVILIDSQWFLVILIDSQWFLVILIDSQWFLVILIDSQWLWKDSCWFSVNLDESVHGCAIHVNSHNSQEIWLNIIV